MTDTVHALYDAVLRGDRDAARAKTVEALREDVAPAEILNNGMIGAMGEVGRRFEDGEYFVPEMLIAARAMKEALAVLKPHLVTADVASAGRVVAGIWMLAANQRLELPARRALPPGRRHPGLRGRGHRRRRRGR